MPGAFSSRRTSLATMTRRGSERPSTAARSAPNRIFFALKGDVTDGHRFIDEARARGAPPSFSKTNPPRRRSPARRCRTSASAGAWRRSRSSLARTGGTLDIRVVAGHGKHGKDDDEGVHPRDPQEEVPAFIPTREISTTTSACRSPFSRRITTTSISCAEVAANHTGEIEFLSGLVRPDIGVITNIGDAHIGHFGGPRQDRRSEVGDFHWNRPRGLRRSARRMTRLSIRSAARRRAVS